MVLGWSVGPLAPIYNRARELSFKYGPYATAAAQNAILKAGTSVGAQFGRNSMNWLFGKNNSKTTRVRRMRQRAIRNSNIRDVSVSDVKKQVQNVLDLKFCDIHHQTTLGKYKIILLNRIDQGNATYNRIGRYITLQKIFIQGNIKQMDTNGWRPLRIALVYDSQSNKNFPTYDEIFQSIDYNGTTTSDWHSPLNPEEIGRFKIIYDKKINGIPSYNQQVNQSIGFYMNKWINENTTYDGATGAIGNINKGALLLVLINDADDNHISQSIDFTSRLSYID